MKSRDTQLKRECDYIVAKTIDTIIGDAIRMVSRAKDDSEMEEADIIEEDPWSLEGVSSIVIYIYNIFVMLGVLWVSG